MRDKPEWTSSETERMTNMPVTVGTIVLGPSCWYKVLIWWGVRVCECEVGALTCRHSKLHQRATLVVANANGGFPTMSCHRYFQPNKVIVTHTHIIMYIHRTKAKIKMNLLYVYLKSVYTRIIIWWCLITVGRLVYYFKFWLYIFDYNTRLQILCTGMTCNIIWGNFSPSLWLGESQELLPHDTQRHVQIFPTQPQTDTGHKAWVTIRLIGVWHRQWSGGSTHE